MVFKITSERGCQFEMSTVMELMAFPSGIGLLRGAADPHHEAVEAHCVGRMVTE